MRRRWQQTVLLVVAGVVLAVVEWTGGSPGMGIAVALAFAVLALVSSPWVFPRPETAAGARQSSGRDGRPIVYWRPGCPYCLRLRATLGRDARKVLWVDIWRDPEAAAIVRSLANGNETVPTVVAGPESAVNPDPSWVRARLPA